MTVFEYWGIQKTEDFGEMVWKLIELGVFGKTEADSKEDFRGVYCFHDVFVAPFAAVVECGPSAAKPGVEVKG